MKQTGLLQTQSSPTYQSTKNSWICPNCKYRHNKPIDTMFKWVNRFETCEKCQKDIELTNPTPDK